MNQCQDPDLFYNQKNKLHQSYLSQLDKTMKEYPAHQMDEPSKYPEQLSILNGITQKIKNLISLVKEKTTTADRFIQRSDVDIRKLKTVERNLSNYTSYEELDVTSKQLLADAIQEYTQEKMIFYIKAVVVLFIFYQLYKTKWKNSVGILVLTLLFFFIITTYKAYTSKG
jgi:hypothetical protein